MSRYENLSEKSHPISAIHKALDILLLFRGRNRHITIEEIVQELALPRSTVYRYVRALSDKGLLEKMGNGHYRPGLALLELGRGALNNNRNLRLIAFPGMQRIAEQTRESVTLMRRFNQQAICIENIEGQYALRVMMERGRTQPLHAGASSKVLLAYLPEGDWATHLNLPLQGFTETTTTDTTSLETQLHRIRQDGYCVSDGEIDVGARALAVPLRNGYGEVIAALSIEAPATRMDNTIIAEYLALLQAEATIIQDALT